MSDVILIIEDEPDLRDVLREVLTSSGYKVHMAANGQEGLERIQDIEPDLILCDRSMPTMTGNQLLSRIRSVYPQYSSVPFIFLTALTSNENEAEVGPLRPYAYLRKPVNFEELLSTIANALKR